MKNPIYLDYNATTPIDPRVAESMRPYLDSYFGNPSSGHIYGRETKASVEKSRQQVAELIGAKTSEIIFTSGGTEANNHAIKGYAFANKHRGNHIIISEVEHPAVSEVCKYLATQGFEISCLPVDATGRIMISDFKKTIKETTILVSVMYANNEVGTLQPIQAISKIAHENNICVHSDCAQAVGKVPVKVDTLGVDLLSIAAHKFYGPKGIGALYIREGIELEKFMHGANHESNKRAGTENILEIVGLGEAARISNTELDKDIKHSKDLANYFIDKIEANIDDIRINGNTVFSLPNTISISFAGIQANVLLEQLEGIAASAGAACHSEGVSLSATIEAMKIPCDFAMGTI